MDFMKVLDQTVREIKREVNIKVLKVPELEQKVLDATSNEPWGPHGSDLAELARATKSFTDRQMIMNVLWTRLNDTGKNWRHVYKALTVIEYFIANGDERAVEDIVEHTYQISSISEFDYVEPNGKDMGINVRKKVQTLLSLLNDKDKIQEARRKAAANRDKYFGLSSTGVTFKSSSASYGSGGSYQGFGSHNGVKENDTFKDSFKDDWKRNDGDEADWKHGDGADYEGESDEKPRRRHGSENERSSSKKGSTCYGRGTDVNGSSSQVPTVKSQGLKTPLDNEDDDFDPRGSSTSGAASHNNMDLLGDSFGDDLIDAAPSETVTKSSNVATEVDLFDNTSFVAAFPPTEASKATQSQVDVDFFSQPASTAAFPSNIDFFSSFNENTAPSMETKSVETQLPKSKPRSSLDPFATIPLDPLDSGDTFGDFTSHADQAPSESLRNSTNKGPNPNTNTAPNTKPPPKNDNFKVKSGIWADSLSRGLIDLNITAPKKTSLADIGIVGLSDGYEQKIESQRAPISYMGRAMGSGSGLAISGFGSTTMDQQFGSFK